MVHDILDRASGGSEGSPGDPVSGGRLTDERE